MSQSTQAYKLFSEGKSPVQVAIERLKREVDDLEAEKRNSVRDFQKLNDQVIDLGKTLESYCLSCQKELAEKDQLYQKRMKLEALVRQFQNNNEEYAKIKKTVEEKVHSVLSDRKMLLKLALLSLTESMRKDPDRYTSLIYSSTSSSSTTPATGHSSDQYYDTASYGQQQFAPQDHYTESDISILLEESEKLYNKLAKEMVDETITDHASSTSSPVLQPTDEDRQFSNTN